MISSLVRWLSTFLFRRFRWVAFGALVRSLTRRTRERSVETATEELAKRLPPSVVKVADAVPGDVLRHGGRVLATGRNARQFGTATRQIGTATKRVHDGRRRLWRGDWRSTVASLRDDWASETTLAEREAWADYHRAMGDYESADDALLDRRPGGPDRSPVPTAPPPVATGRRRPITQPRRVVKRVQRTYRQAAKPWDGRP